MYWTRVWDLVGCSGKEKYKTVVLFFLTLKFVRCYWLHSEAINIWKLIRYLYKIWNNDVMVLILICSLVKCNKLWDNSNLNIEC